MKGHLLLLGNDIVDLQEAGAAEKPRDQRFLERVFTPAERTCIARACDPALALWMLWSGKESTFKIARKLNPEIVFSHRDYAYGDEALALLGHCDPLSKRLSANMLYCRLQISLYWRWNRDYVHCVAGWFHGETSTGERLDSSISHSVATLGKNRERISPLSAREEESVYSRESREVRILAKRMLIDQHQLQNPEIVRNKEASRFLPPVVWEDGHPAPGIDLSLSHDGRFVAAVVSL